MNKAADMKIAWDIVSSVSKRIGDPSTPRPETHDSWKCFRFCMGWDRRNNPWRYAQYLKALMDAFPNNRIESDTSITINYTKKYVNETFEEAIVRDRIRNQNYLDGILDEEHCNRTFIKIMQNRIELECGFTSGYAYQLMIDPNYEACKLSGLTKGYFKTAHTFEQAKKIKALLFAYELDSIVLICKAKHDDWYIIQTWPKYVPEGWKREDFEYKRSAPKKKAKPKAKPKVDDTDAWLVELFNNHKDVFTRLANGETTSYPLEQSGLENDGK